MMKRHEIRFAFLERGGKFCVAALRKGGKQCRTVIIEACHVVIVADS